MHLVNVGLHALNSVLLFLGLASLTGKVWRSGFVAALFAWHPLHVESVGWIAERKDVLSTLFFLLTIGAYAGYARAKADRARGRGGFTAGRWVVRAGVDGETDGGDAAVCVVVAGCVAAGAAGREAGKLAGWWRRRFRFFCWQRSRAC